MHSCLTLSIIRYGSRVSEAINGKKYCLSLHVGVVTTEMESSSYPQLRSVNFCMCNLKPNLMVTFEFLTQNFKKIKRNENHFKT